MQLVYHWTSIHVGYSSSCSRIDAPFGYLFVHGAHQFVAGNCSNASRCVTFHNSSKHNRVTGGQCCLLGLSNGLLPSQIQSEHGSVTFVFQSTKECLFLMMMFVLRIQCGCMVVATSILFRCVSCLKSICTSQCLYSCLVEREFKTNC